MKKTIYFSIIAFLLFSACHHNKKEGEITVKAQTQSELIQLFNQGDSLFKIGAPDTMLMCHFVADALDFVKLHPEESAAPEILMRAGETCIRLAEYSDEHLFKTRYAKKALDIYNKVQKVYPDFADIKMCYFNRGVIYDDILQDYESAKFEYSDYIHKYPEDSLSVQLRTYIKFLGKSPEEIMKETCQSQN